MYWVINQVSKTNHAYDQTLFYMFENNKLQKRLAHGKKLYVNVQNTSRFVYNVLPLQLFDN